MLYKAVLEVDNLKVFFIYFIYRGKTPCASISIDLSSYDLVYTDMRGLDVLKREKSFNALRYISYTDVVMCTLWMDEIFYGRIRRRVSFQITLIHLS